MMLSKKTIWSLIFTTQFVLSSFAAEPTKTTTTKTTAKPGVVTKSKNNAASVKKVKPTTKAKMAAAAVTPAPAQTSTTITPAPAEKKFLSFNLSADVTYSQGVDAPKDGKVSRSVSYNLLPMMTTGPIKSIIWFPYSQDLNDSASSEWQDIPVVIAAAKPFEAGRYFTLSPGVSFLIPQTRATKDVSQLNYAANANVVVGLNSKNVGWDNVVLQWQPGFTQMNNDFSTSTKGEPLTAYRIRNRINFWYSFTDNIIWKSRLQIDANFSYENIVRNNFLHFELIEYRFGAGTYYTQLGHTNLGPVLEGTNYENNFKLYDSASSQYFLTLGADF